MRRFYYLFAVLSLFASCTRDIGSLKSPDGRYEVLLSLDRGTLHYTLRADGREVLGPSRLGIATAQSDFSQHLKPDGSDGPVEGRYDYDFPLGRQAVRAKPYREQTFYLRNDAGARLGVRFRLADDGAAFAYLLEGSGRDTVVRECTQFRLPPEARGFLQPLSAGKSGWKRTGPAYEEHYVAEAAPGTPSDFGQGWVFPALFRTGDRWILLSETGVAGDYTASHLADDSTGGLFRLEFAHADNNLPEDPETPVVVRPFATPWRTIVLGDSPADIAESTMAQDLVEARFAPEGDYTPGKAAWSWLAEDDPGTTYENTCRYIDMAARLGFAYCLIDALWDTQIGRERIPSLVRYAATRGVRLVLWYNSNGNWNDAPQGPLHLMDTREARRGELQWLQRTGIAGIKVDFFGGDKQRGMQLYEELLADANDFGISVNLHGATLPRGWERMYPNMITAEAVRGMENSKYDRQKEAERPALSTIAVFTRNVVAPMDFTPTVLNPAMEVYGNRIERITTAAFELALPVVFYSPLQHLGVVPENCDEFPDFVWDYLREVPTVWDETRCLAGYPGKDAVMARRKDSVWYVAGINAEKRAKTFELTLPATGEAVLIRDRAEARNAVEQSIVGIPDDGRWTQSVAEYGGFVLIISDDSGPKNGQEHA